MTRTSEVQLSFLWAGLLILGSLVPASVQANESDGELVIQIDDGLVTLAAENARLQNVLNEIATQSGFRIVQHVHLDQRVTLNIKRQSLPELLRQILANNSYQLYQAPTNYSNDGYRGPESDTLWIFSEGSSIAPAATMFFENLLFQGNVRERKEAIRGLRRLGTTDAVRSISLALGDDESSVRDLAFDALERIGGDEALAAIASASMDEDAWVRGESATALASSDSATAVEYLNMALQDPNPKVRIFVIEALADIPGEESAHALSSMLADDSPAVRMQAVDALEQIGGNTALRTLMNARNDEDLDVRDAVNDALLLLDRTTSQNRKLLE